MMTVKDILNFLQSNEGKTKEPREDGAFGSDLKATLFKGGVDLDALGLTVSDLKKLRDDKMIKYNDLVRNNTKLLFPKLPKDIATEQILDEASLILLTEITKYYTTPELFKEFFKEKMGGKPYNDLHIGPMILRGLGSAKIGNDGRILKRVKGGVFDLLRSNDILSPADRSAVNHMRKFIDNYKDKNKGIAPTEQQLADDLDLPLETVKKYLFLSSVRDTVYDDAIDSMRGHDFAKQTKSGTGSLDGDNPELIIIKADLLSKANKVMASVCTPEERHVMELSVFCGFNPDVVAKLMGKDASDVDDLSASAVKKLTPELKRLYGSDVLFTLDVE